MLISWKDLFFQPNVFGAQQQQTGFFRVRRRQGRKLKKEAELSFFFLLVVARIFVAAAAASISTPFILVAKQDLRFLEVASVALTMWSEGSFGGLVGRALTFMPEVRSSNPISDIYEHFSTNVVELWLQVG